MTSEKPKQGVYYRINQKGDRERVIAKKGKRPEETLNELTSQILGLLESIASPDMVPALSAEQPLGSRMVNQPSPPQLIASRGDSIRAAGDTITNMTGSTPLAGSLDGSTLGGSPLGSDFDDKDIVHEYPGDGLDYGATHSESFTGTSAVAIRPAAFNVANDEDDEMSKKNDPVLNEWLPGFAGGGDYEPGDYEMPSPTGDGVADRKPTESGFDKTETETSNMGKEWPRKHAKTAAMCDVDEDGTEHEPQGVHKSSVGKPDDGHQSKVSHNWPDQPKNTGSGVAEPVKGNRWSDSGELKGSGPDEWTISQSGPGMPKEGPITGTSGPQLGQVSTEWSPSRIGTLMGESEVDIQALFDSYARQSTYVTVEDFQNLCDAHGLGTQLDETSLLRLMKDNEEFMFFDGRDASGTYWVPTLEESKTSNGKIINEFQVRSPEMEAGLHDMPELMAGDPMDDFGSGAGKPGLGGACPDGECGIDEIGIDGEFMGDTDIGDTGMGQMECPGCGFKGQEDTCPECGSEMMGFDAESEIPDHRGGMGGFGENTVEMSPAVMESLRNFFGSAKSLLANAKKTHLDQKSVAEALTHSWLYHAKQLNPHTVPDTARKTLQEMTKRFPGFNPFTIKESGGEAMGAPTGTKIGSGGADSTDLLPKTKTDMKQIGTKENPISRKPVNDHEATPIIPGSGRGMSESAVKKNISKLSRYVTNALRESAAALRGKYNLSFAVTVNEHGKACRDKKKKSRTKKRNRLAEALADAEEILQFHDPKDVSLETSFHNLKGVVTVKQDIPLLTIAPRGPIFAEGATLFRFRRNAEKFANKLVAEGFTCKITPHNWGAALTARIPQSVAKNVFAAIVEESKS